MLSQLQAWLGMGQQAASAANSARETSLSPLARAVLEITAVLVVVVFFTWLGGLLQLDRYVGVSRPELRHYWLGVLVLLIYLAIRMALLLRGNLRARRAVPDIDAALKLIVQKLAEAKLDLKSVPIHIVLGTTGSQENQLAWNDEVERTIRIADNHLPVHCFGGNNGLWITLPQVSALSRQASAFEPLWLRPGLGTAEITDAHGTVSMGQNASSQWESDEPRREIFAQFTLNADLREEAGRRTRYLLEQVRMLRQPYCPINSILVALPLPLVNTGGADSLASALRTDMVAAHEALGIKCLTMVVLTALESTPGFQEYVQRLPEENHHRRVGCSFPSFVTPVAEDADGVHRWIADAFEAQVLGMFGKEVERVRSNEGLFSVVHLLGRSRDGLRLWLDAAFPPVAEKTYLGGVYFASFGQIGTIKQPFLTGLLKKIQASHDELIGWTDDTLARHREQSRWAMILTIVAILLLIGSTGLLLWAALR